MVVQARIGSRSISLLVINKDIETTPRKASQSTTFFFLLNSFKRIAPYFTLVKAFRQFIVWSTFHLFVFRYINRSHIRTGG